MDKLKKSLRMKKRIFITAGLMCYDMFAVTFSYLLALWLRFDGKFSAVPKDYIKAFQLFFLPYAAVAVVIFFIMKMYHSMWRFASYSEFIRSATGSLLTSAVYSVAITGYMHFESGYYERMPLSYYIWGAFFQTAMVVLIRFSYRFSLKFVRSLRTEEKTNVMVIGAGDAGQLIIRDINNTKDLHEKVCCIIDDNPYKWDRYIDNIPVVGDREMILVSVEKYEIKKIYVAIPSAKREDLREILNICSETNCEVKNLPGVYQLVNGDVSVAAMKDVSVEDLLGRETIKVRNKEIFDSLSDKVILVTGGGGSIGSELCRQIAQHAPRQLIIFDVYENNAYSIQQELKRTCPSLNLTVLIGSVRDSRRLEYVFKKYHPDIVYHAAAHKHVPLMEDSPCESIKNNVIGTYKTAYAALLNGCHRFVLISTDKAVNPTNIMGASKRLCEMVIQSFDRKVKEGKVSEIPKLFTHLETEFDSFDIPEDAKTEFVAVRFGNVLGSNGSVIPLFKRQIEEGGPVTVTHPDIIRYFMTIPEAVSLVLTAGTYAEGGEIFVLDMGSPVKIDTLARNLIRLSGFKPDIDIKIEYTGLRPGEKLYEEKLMEEEGLKTTPNKLIHIGCPIPFDVDGFYGQLGSLMTAAYANDENIRKYVREMVSTYKEEANV